MVDFEIGQKRYAYSIKWYEHKLITIKNEKVKFIRAIRMCNERATIGSKVINLIKCKASEFILRKRRGEIALAHVQ